MAAESQSPLLKFGVLADVQYANCEDRPPTGVSGTRYYRAALGQVDRAFEVWEREGATFVLQLGDIIDGLNRKCGGSYSGLRDTLSHFERHTTIPTFHTVGNHELYNFDRRELARLFYNSVSKICIPPEVFCPVEPEESPVLYYEFCPHPSLKCISLDCFDVSVLGYQQQHPKYQEASAILQEKHGHDNFDHWDCVGKLQGLDVRFQQMNGAVSLKQLQWLEKQLDESEQMGQNVIVFGHVSLNPDCTDWSCLLWNYQQVVEVFHKHTCVRAYFSGHTHASGFATDSQGIGYVSCAGIVETPPDTTAFATVSLHHHHMEVLGHGMELSHVILFTQHESEEQITSEKTSAVVESEVEPASATVKVEV